MEKLEQYSLFIGLNDAMSKKQEISTEDAIKTVSNVIQGGSISQIHGVYTHEDGTKVNENTLRVDVLYTDDATVRLYCQDLKKLLNQESILVQKQEINGMFV